MKRLVFISVLAIMLASCGNKDYGDYIYRRSFAMDFHEIERLELGPSVHTSKLIFKIKPGIYVYSFYNHTDKEQAIYDALCQKYGDMGYDREELVPIGGGPSFLAYSPVSIKIVSDANFDAEHLEGTSLGDIVMYDGQSSKPFIDSGYQMYYWEDLDKFYYYQNVHERPYYPVYKKVSELTAYDLMLIYSPWVGTLHFQTLPTMSQRHNITVTFTDERGETFSDTIEINFE